jgi:hypothetical protein
MLRKLRFVIAGLVIIAANQAAGYAVHAAMPNTALAAGSTRYYVLSRAAYASTSSGAWTNVSGMSTTINVPAGKHGDVMVLFCGSAGATGTPLYVRAMVGSAAALPSSKLLTNISSYAGNCAQFYKLGLSAGSRNLKMQWQTNGGGTGAMGELTMIVLLNIH